MISPLPENERLSITISFPLRNESELDTFLDQVYDSRTKNYRHFLSVNEFTERFSPTDADYQTVTRFFLANGFQVTETASNRLILNLDAKVADINRVFNIKLGHYRNPKDGRMFIAPNREPSVNIAVPLWHVGGIDTYSIPKSFSSAAVSHSAQTNSLGSGPGGSFLGSDKRSAYYGGTSLNGGGQTIGLFMLDGYDINDVKNYYSLVSQTFNVQVTNSLVLGALPTSDGDDLEQAIDITESASMAPAALIRAYIAPKSPFSEGRTDTAIFNKMATEQIANQLSVSYGWNPADPGIDEPIFKELAAQGQSLFVASGDSGSFQSENGFIFPAEDPYVTAVGGTVLTTSGAGGPWLAETTWASSGGGIALTGIRIPNYQQLPGVINSTNHGSAGLRNVPDVAAEASNDNFICFNGMCSYTVYGTSLASPIWAGFVALVNQEAANNGQAAVGFLNPTIYNQFGTKPNSNLYFHDITVGSNGGYSAVPGYDLTTGWGSPIGSNLISALAIGSGQCGYAGPGRILKSGASLTSCDGRFTLAMQSSDGNLVLYWNGNSALWATATQGNPGAWVGMQSDGNFVVYSAQSQALWNSGTQGNPGAFLNVQNDGNLVVYDAGGVPLWNSNTCCH
jgi:subtilase family serine protease